MPSLDLIARFIGVDAGQGAMYDRMSAKATSTDAAMSRFAKGSALALGAIAVGSIKAAGDYQKLTVNLVTGAGEQQKNLKMVQDGMLHMAGQVGYSADTLAKAMYTVESAGFHGANALNVLKTAAEGAKVDNADLTTVVDALTSAMNAYHVPTQNAAKVTNTLIASASVGKMHLQDLTDALGTVLPTAAALRIPLDQVGAAMATMTSQGTDANRAATYLRFSMAALANPTAKAQKQMGDLGLTSTQVATEIMHGGLPGVFTMLEDAVGRKFPVGSAKYLAALANMVGGTRGLQAVLELTGKHLGTMNSNLGTIDTRVRGAGNSVSDWSNIQKTFNQQLDEFASGLQADAIGIGMHLLPAATDLMKVLEGGTHVLGDVVGFFEKNRVAAIALGAVLGATLVPAIVKTGIAMGAIGFEKLYRMLYGLATNLVNAAIGFRTAGAAVVTFGEESAALDLNPILASIGLVAGAATVLIGLFHKSGESSQQAAAKIVQGMNIQTNSAQSYQAALDGLIAQEKRVTAARDAYATPTKSHFPLDSVINSYNDQLHNLHQSYIDVVGQQQLFYGHLNALSTALGRSKGDVLALAGAAGVDLTGNLAQVELKLQGAEKAASLSHHPMQQAAADMRQIGTAGQTTADDLTSLDSAWNNLVGIFVGKKVAVAQARDSIDALHQALIKSHGSMSANTAAGRQAIEAFGGVSSSLDSAAQAVLQTTHSYTATRKAVKSLVAETLATLPQGSAAYKQFAKESAHFIDGLRHKAERAGEDTPKGLVNGLNRGKSSVAGAAQALTQHMIEQFGNLPGDVTKKGTAAVSAAAKQAQQTANTVANAITSKMKTLPGQIHTTGVATGTALDDGMIGGLQSKQGPVYDAAYAVGLAAAKGAHKGAGAASPSKLTRHTGRMLDDGLILGLNDHTPSVVAAASTVGKKAAQAVDIGTRQVFKSMLRGLTDGWHGLDASMKDALPSKYQDALSNFTTHLGNEVSKQESHLKKMESNYRSLAQARKQAISSLRGTISGGSDLSNIFTQDAAGNPLTLNASGYLSSQVGPLQTFAHDLTWARQHHLNQNLLSQIANLGPVQGDVVLKQFMTGVSSVGQANQAEALIQRYAGIAAKVTVDSPGMKQQLKNDQTKIGLAKESLAAQNQTNRHLERLLSHVIAHGTSFTRHGSSVKVKITGKDLIKAIKEEERTSGKQYLFGPRF